MKHRKYVRKLKKKIGELKYYDKELQKQNRQICKMNLRLGAQLAALLAPVTYDDLMQQGLGYYGGDKATYVEAFNAIIAARAFPGPKQGEQHA